MVRLVRTLLRIRRDRPHIRRGTYYFFNDWDRYQQNDVLMFAHFDGPQYTLVALNFGDVDQNVPFWFPVGGNYVEELHGGDLDLKAMEGPRRMSSSSSRSWASTASASNSPPFCAALHQLERMLEGQAADVFLAVLDDELVGVPVSGVTWVWLKVTGQPAWACTASVACSSTWASEVSVRSSPMVGKSLRAALEAQALERALGVLAIHDSLDGRVAAPHIGAAQRAGAGNVHVLGLCEVEFGGRRCRGRRR